jgi:hypothetical protein
MVDVTASLGDAGRFHLRKSGQRAVVKAGDTAAFCGPFPQVREFDRQDRRLQPVETAVDALDLVITLPAVARVKRGPFGKFVVVCHETPGIAHRAEQPARFSAPPGQGMEAPGPQRRI